MAQNNPRWTAPSFSFNTADQPTAWRDFYTRAIDYVEAIGIDPEEEYQQKRGWKQITMMFTGENRQTLQTLIDNNTITAGDQRTLILALKYIQRAIKDKEHYWHYRGENSATMATNSATMATRSSTKCPWRKFYKHITKYMNILHTEACKPQEKIAKLVYAVTYHFASPIVDLEQNKKSTKQMQTTEQPRRMTQDPSSSTKRTANTETIDTDSAYSTDTESSYTPQMENTKFSSLQDHTKNITRPSTSSQSITILEEEISSTSTRTHPAPPPRPSKGQQITNTKCIQGTKPLHVPIPTKSNSKTSHRSTSTHQPKPSTSTQSNTETTIKQPTVPATRTSSASTYPQRTRKTPLLPTPPVQARQFYNRNHYNQHISGPSPPRYSTYSAFSRPATLNNYRYYLQPHIPEPNTAFPLYLHQEFFTRPYQQTPLLPLPAFTGPYQQMSGHFPQQVYYFPVILPHPLQHYTL